MRPDVPAPERTNSRTTGISRRSALDNDWFYGVLRAVRGNVRPNKKAGEMLITASRTRLAERSGVLSLAEYGSRQRAATRTQFFTKDDWFSDTSSLFE